MSAVHMVWDTRNAPLRRITPDLDQKTYDQVKAEHLPLCRITPGFDVYCEKAGKDTFTVMPFSAAFICTARPSFIGNEKTPFICGGSMFITVTGMLGSGKSTVCAILKEKYGFEVFNTGTMLRKMAADHNMTVEEYNAYLIEHTGNADKIIDSACMETAKRKQGENVVFDSRLAWFFIPESYKVFLKVDPEEAAKRVLTGAARQNETYSDLKEAEKALVSRRQSEVRRFRMLYGADCDDMSNFDIVIDTTDISPQEAASLIMEGLQTYKK